MTDDPTAGDWQPSADQPIVPAEPEKQLSEKQSPPAAPPPSWQPPAYGPPPPPPSHPTAPVAGWVGPEPTYRADFGPPGNVDYIASPERASHPRRRSGVLVAAAVVVLALIAGGIAVFATSNSVGKPTATAVASSSASPAPSDSQQAPSAPSSAPGSPQQPQSSDDAAAGPLDKYLLAPTDLGAGTLMALIPGGRSVGDQATLDFCNFTYTSEKLRTARVQVQYASGSQSASNEFVRYRAGGAASAYAEIQKAVSGCPSTYREPGGVVSQIKRVSGLTGLVSKSLAVTFASTSTGEGGVSTVWTTVVYQFDGDYFSGVYVYGTDKSRVQSLAATLSARSAKYLAEAAAGQPGTGGGPLVETNPTAPGAQT